jgi:hypothetical protein
MSTSIKRMSQSVARVDEPLPNRPMDANAPLLTPEEEAAYMEALAVQKKVVEERFKPPPPPREWSLPLWAQGICIAVVLALLLSPRPWWGTPPAPLAFDVAQGTRMQMWLAVHELERARVATGFVPRTLAGRESWGLQLEVRASGSYKVSAPATGISWSSGQRTTLILDGIPRTISAGLRAGAR